MYFKLINYRAKMSVKYFQIKAYTALETLSRE